MCNYELLCCSLEMNNQQMSALKDIIRDNEKYLHLLGSVEVDIS